MIAAAAAAAAAHCCDGEELRVPGSPQPYARRVRGSWRDYLEPPDDGVDVVSDPYVYDDSYDSYDDDDDDDVDEEEEDSYDDSYDDDEEEDGDEDCSCCSLCSSGGGRRRGRDTPPTSFRSSSSSSSSSSTGSSVAAKAAANTSAPPPTHRHLSPVFEPSMRGSCRCIRCQKRRYSLDFFKSSDFRRGIPSPNVYMIDERSCKIVHDYIHDRDLQIGHRPANVVKDKKLNFVTWEPYFCVLLQDEQTLTAYRSEELSIFPGTALRTITHAFKLMERRQRSIPIPYSYGYHYNPIEPSMGLDSRINTFKPIYQNVKMSTHDVNSVPRTQYQPKNSLYDSEYISVQDIPSLFPEEDSYDYKYLGSPLNKYLTRPSTQESGVAINLVAIKKTSVFDYGFPTYKSPYSSDSVWNFGSKIPNIVFEDPQSVESDPETFKVSSPTVEIVKLFPETSEQESIITTTKNDELNYKTTQETPTKAELYPTTSEEFRTEDEPSFITTEETQTEDESNSLVLKEDPTKEGSIFIITKDTITEDKLNPIPSGEFLTEDEWDHMVLKENPTKDESSFLATEETLTEDKTNSITTEGTQTEDESNSLVLKKDPTEDKSNPITSEELPTEDELSFLTTEETLTEDISNSITTEETQTEDESNSIEFNSIKIENKSNSITTEENQKEDDESMSTASQETTTDFNLNINKYSSVMLRLRDLLKKIEDERNKSLFRTVDNIPAKSQSNVPSKTRDLWISGANMFDEY